MHADSRRAKLTRNISRGPLLANEKLDSIVHSLVLLLYLEEPHLHHSRSCWAPPFGVSRMLHVVLPTSWKSGRWIHPSTTSNWGNISRGQVRSVKMVWHNLRFLATPCCPSLIWDSWLPLAVRVSIRCWRSVWKVRNTLGLVAFRLRFHSCLIFLNYHSLVRLLVVCTAPA